MDQIAEPVLEDEQPSVEIQADPADLSGEYTVRMKPLSQGIGADYDAMILTIENEAGQELYRYDAYADGGHGKWDQREADVDLDAPAKIEGDMEKGYTVTNTHTPQGLGPELCVITYDFNGGVLEGNKGPVKITCEKGEVIEIMEAQAREGYEFQYWKGSKYMPGDSYTVTEDHTFVAQWQPGKDDPDDPEHVIPRTGIFIGEPGSHDGWRLVLLLAVSHLTWSGLLLGKAIRKRNRDR